MSIPAEVPQKSPYSYLRTQIKRIHPAAQIPTIAKPGDAGADIYAIEDHLIPAGKREMIRTGLMVAFDPGRYLEIRSRSGLAVKNGLIVMTGTVDANYRGEIKVVLFNTSDQDYQVKVGDRIAQMVILPIFTPIFEDVLELPPTERGEGGMGHSGR